MKRLALWKRGREAADRYGNVKVTGSRGTLTLSHRFVWLSSQPLISVWQWKSCLLEFMNEWSDSWVQSTVVSLDASDVRFQKVLGKEGSKVASNPDQPCDCVVGRTRSLVSFLTLLLSKPFQRYMMESFSTQRNIEKAFWTERTNHTLSIPPFSCCPSGRRYKVSRARKPASQRSLVPASITILNKSHKDS